ncbi:MAG: hypothetical protein LWX56_09955 [Ignavibacteria bacterium]|nr:hypothetical protein [Ignavibacteria bacterium]
MLPKYLILYTSVLLIICISSCSAPRNNPLDTENPQAVLGVLYGTVQSFSVPRKPLGDVSIVKNNKVIGISQADGTYSIENILPEDGWVFFQKSGYITDSIFVNWNGAKSTTVNSILYQIPILDSLAVYSSVSRTSATSYSGDVYISAKITDKDKSVDTVFVFYPDYNYKAPLIYNPNTKAYELTLSPASLNVTGIDNLLGVPCTVITKDVYSRVFTIGGSSIKRVLTTTIIPKGPINNDTTDSRPYLRWETYSPSFPFTIMLQVYSRTDESSQLVWQKEKISGTDSVQVDITLPVGDYYWVAWAVDNYSDRLRSASFRFVVK